MKLKSVLIIILLALTIVPLTIVLLLLYKSGYDLSKESYSRNLIESLNVQSDYISQAIESNMIADYRFAQKSVSSITNKEELLTEFSTYLNDSEDMIAVCILLDSHGEIVYSIGEKGMADTVKEQVSSLSETEHQRIQEFEWKDGNYSLGIVTPVWNQNAYQGCLISVYDKSYLFKVISSYYEIADSSTYICRENGAIISARNTLKEDSTEVERALQMQNFSDEGRIDVHLNGLSLTGYYKNIHNTPWYLSGFLDKQSVFSFANGFLNVYILILVLVIVADILLGLYCSYRVVKPINSLIQVIGGYQNDLNNNQLAEEEEGGYVETNYLRKEFFKLMNKIQLTQHNFAGIYQLYESNDMGDVNIDIDVVEQTISCNKDMFKKLIEEVEVPEEACIVETFTHCFCEKDQLHLLRLFEQMRDEHLSAMQETEIYTPNIGGKWYHSLIVPVYENDRLARLFVQLRDITSLKEREFQSSEQAKRDPLTGLNNRVGFTSCINNILMENREDSVHGLLFIDMNYFKLVNDNFGHSAGDDLLKEVAGKLLVTTRPEDIVSRFGGDEFAVFLPNITKKALSKVEQRLKECLVYPFENETVSFEVSASIGASLWCQDSSQTLDEILRQADEEMYESKRDFKRHKENAI